MKETLEFILPITDLTTDGRGIGHLVAEDRMVFRDGEETVLGANPLVGMTVFVDGALPGDLAHVRVFRQEKRMLSAVALSILALSVSRCDAPCPHAEICDGCPLMAFNDAAEREWKRRTLSEVLERVGGLSQEEMPTIHVIDGPTLGYRNKVNMRVTAEGLLGYTRRGSHSIFPVDTCEVAAPAIQSLICRWNAAAKEDPTIAQVCALIRMVVLRATPAGETMVLLITDPLKEGERKRLFARLAFLEASVLCQSENKRPDDVRVREPLAFATEKHALPMSLCGLTFFVSPGSFFQVNRFLHEDLYTEALSYFEDEMDEPVLDLYCGTGTTSLLLAQKAAGVIGVEAVASAVRDAKESAARNGVTNVAFHRARAEDVLGSLTKGEGFRSRRLLVDPPRKGLDGRVVSAILDSAIEEMVYISCNPATLARDIKRLREGGFRLMRLSLVDQFPQTGNMECTTLLRREPRNRAEV